MTRHSLHILPRDCKRQTLHGLNEIQVKRELQSFGPGIARIIYLQGKGLMVDVTQPDTAMAIMTRLKTLADIPVQFSPTVDRRSTGYLSDIKEMYLEEELLAELQEQCYAVISCFKTGRRVLAVIFRGAHLPTEVKIGFRTYPVHAYPSNKTGLEAATCPRCTGFHQRAIEYGYGQPIVHPTFQACCRYCEAKAPVRIMWGEDVHTFEDRPSVAADARKGSEMAEANSQMAAAADEVALFKESGHAIELDSMVYIDA